MRILRRIRRFFGASKDFDEVSWELAANYTLSGGMNVYGAIQNGCQSGQFPARPYCLFGETVDGVKPAAPLTPELTFSISPEMRVPMNGGGEVVLRADYSYRDEMFGEPSSRLTSRF
jgi:hypothetical protein